MAQSMARYASCRHAVMPSCPCHRWPTVPLAASAQLLPRKHIMDQKPDWAALLPAASKPAFIMQKLIVTDLERSLAFYTGAIGLRLLYKIAAPELPFAENILGFDGDAGGAQLVISGAFRQGVSPGMAPYGTPFPKAIPFTNSILQLPDIPAILPLVQEYGGRIAMSPHKLAPHIRGGALIAFIQDPDGHVIEIFQFAPFEESWPDFDVTAPPQGLLDLYAGA